MQESAKTEFPLADYFRLLGIPENLSLQPSVETLYFVVNKHAFISYQNIHFHLKDRKSQPISIQALKEKMIDREEGGMCYENLELLYQALIHMGFNVIRTPAFNLINAEYNPIPPSSHLVLIATIDRRQFFIDTGFGYNGVRYPLEFTFDKTEEIALNSYEKYKLICNEDHYVFCMLIKDQWFTLHRFSRPFNVIDDATNAENCRIVLETPHFLATRDKYIKIGKVKQEGRVGFHYEPKVRPFFAWRMDVNKEKTTKTEIHDYKTLQESVKNEVGVVLPDQELLRLDD